MLVVTESDIKNNLSMNDAIQAVSGAFEDYSRHQIKVPSRISMDVRGSTDSAIFLVANYLSMPYYGIKEASSFPGNVEKGQSTVLSNIQLYSAESGQLLALIHANHLTAMKTGAAAAVATDTLALKGGTVLSIIGTGIQAQTQLRAIQEVRQLKEVRVYDLDQRRARDFVEFGHSAKNRDYPITIMKSADACVAGATIVSTCTTSTTPVFSGEAISKGTHINAIGPFTPVMQEIDTNTVLQSSKIVTDNMEETWEVAGDLLVPFNDGLITQSKLTGNIGDILIGKLKGREHDDEITIYESVGFAALDIAVAILVYKKLKTI